MKENKFAISLPSTGKNVNSYSIFNLSKCVITGPGEWAVKFTEALLKNPGFIGMGFDTPEHANANCQAIPAIAASIAVNLWEEAERRGWVLEQDLPEPTIEGDTCQGEAQGAGTSLFELARALREKHEDQVKIDVGDVLVHHEEKSHDGE
jgi:hypothetical protein